MAGETESRPLLQAKEDHFLYCTCRQKMRFALARCKNKKNKSRIRARYGHDSCMGCIQAKPSSVIKSRHLSHEDDEDVEDVEDLPLGDRWDARSAGDEVERQE